MRIPRAREFAPVVRPFCDKDTLSGGIFGGVGQPYTFTTPDGWSPGTESTNSVTPIARMHWYINANRKVPRRTFWAMDVSVSVMPWAVSRSASRAYVMPRMTKIVFSAVRADFVSSIGARGGVVATARTAVNAGVSGCVSGPTRIWDSGCALIVVLVHSRKSGGRSP